MKVGAGACFIARGIGGRYLLYLFDDKTRPISQRRCSPKWAFLLRS